LIYAYYYKDIIYFAFSLYRQLTTTVFAVRPIGSRMVKSLSKPKLGFMTTSCLC